MVMFLSFYGILLYNKILIELLIIVGYFSFIKD